MKKRLLLCLALAGTSAGVGSAGGVLAQDIYALAQRTEEPRELKDTSTSAAAEHRNLKQVMNDLRKERGIYFMFNNHDIQDTPVRARIPGTDESVENVLEAVLNPAGLTYKKVDNIYVIMENQESKIKKRIHRAIEEANANRVSLQEYLTKNGIEEEQVLQVSGHVVSEFGEGLPGVNILVKGTTIGTVTDMDGNFTLNVPDGDGVLVFSFIGYLSQEVAIGSRSQIDVTMEPDVQTLSDVVVVGYGTQKKSEVTSAAVSVKSDDFRQGGARNAMDLVQGKIAGVSVSRAAATNPNSSPSMQIRGLTSSSGGTSPLIVIDGIPGGNLDLIQQSDIESIDVLKDGSAAAIYGTRANAGVILITTKKGVAGPPKFDYSSYVRHEEDQMRPDFMNAKEYREQLANGYSGSDEGHSVDAYDKLINHSNISQYHSLAMSGGSENTTYRASMFYSNLEAVTIANSREQYGYRVNIQTKALNDMLTAQLDVSNNYSKADLRQGGTSTSSAQEWALTRNPTMALKDDDGNWQNEASATNYVGFFDEEINARNQITTSASGRVSLEPIKGLKASMFGSVQHDSWRDHLYYDLGNEISDENSYSGYASKYNYQDDKYAFEPTIEYNTFVGTDHSIKFLGGYSWRYEVWDEYEMYNSGYLNDVFEDNNIGTGIGLSDTKYPDGMSSWKEDNTLIAFFGRVNYTFRDKYMFQAIFRREGSSKFGANYKWGNFPAVSAGWNISQEDFMQGVSFVDNLKFRIGYGETGNSNIGNYNSLVTLSKGNYYLYSDGIWRQTYGASRNPNPDLRWETKKEVNAGFDFSFLGWLSGSLDLYSRVTSDLIDEYNTPQPAYVQNTIIANVGSITAKGIELALNADIIRSGDIRWKAAGTFATANNKMKSFSNDIYTTSNLQFSSIGGNGAMGKAISTFEGGNMGDFYGKKYAGINEDGEWLFYNREGEKVTADEIDSSIGTETTDLRVLGNSIPNVYTSLTNTVSYKNWSLRVFLRGRFGYQILNTMRIAYGNQITGGNLLKEAFKDADKIGDSYQYSDYYLEDGGYLKVDEVTLAYTVPDGKVPYVRNLKLYATVSNLATFTNYTGGDPDYVEVNGLDTGLSGRSVYPSSKSFLIGVNLGF